MSKISQELLEIKDLLKDSGQKIDSISGSNVANNVENQIVYNGSYIFKPLKNYDKEISVQKIHFTRQVKISLFLIFFSIFLGLISFFLFPYFIFIAENGEKIFNFNYFIMTSFMLLIIYFALYLVGNVIYVECIKSKLKIENDKLILSSRNNQIKVIEYKNIRSFRLEKNILGFGTDFFIYKVNEIEPCMSFKIISIHTLIAIEELLKSKINEIIKK